MVATDLFFFVQRVGCHVPKHFGSMLKQLHSIGKSRILEFRDGLAHWTRDGEPISTNWER